MIILGIDPGYERCGFAVIEKSKAGLKLMDYGVIKTAAGKAFELRLEEIGDDFQHLVDRYKPDILSIEDLFFAQNVTTAMKVSQVRGVLNYLAHKSGLQIVEPKPVEIKKAFCGDGKADKKAMQQMAQMTFKLDSKPKLDDAADAIGAAFYASHICF